MNAESRAVFNGYTASELQTQYSARAAVPEHPAIFERWREGSAAFRREAADRARLDLAYGPGERERLDLFLPHAPRPAPLHVFFHGGYWQSMDRRNFSFVARELTAAGLAVAVAGYPLCPTVDLDAIVAAGRRALAWLLRDGPHLGVDVEAVQISGHSAGGQLAAMLARTDWPAIDVALPERPVDRILPVSGVFELEPLIHTRLNDALRLDRAQARRCSPLHLAPPTGVRLDAWVGGEESAEFQRQSRQLTAHWATTGTAACHRLAGHNHFTVLEALYGPDGPLVAAATQGRGA